MIKRTKLGSTYTKSPAQAMKETLESNTSKILFTIFICICYLVILRLMVGVVHFLGTEIGTYWNKEETTASMLFNHPGCLPFKVVGIIGIIFYVFRDKLTNR